MTYKEALTDLDDAVYAAIRAGLREGKKVSDLQEMAADIDHLIDHGHPRAARKEVQTCLAQVQGEIVNALAYLGTSAQPADVAEAIMAGSIPHVKVEM